MSKLKDITIAVLLWPLAIPAAIVLVYVKRQLP